MNGAFAAHTLAACAVPTAVHNSPLNLLRNPDIVFWGSELRFGNPQSSTSLHVLFRKHVG